MTERAWPTVPEILASAKLVSFSDLGARYLDQQNESRKVHGATASNLYKALRNNPDWIECRADPQRTTFTRAGS